MRNVITHVPYLQPAKSRKAMFSFMPKAGSLSLLKSKNKLASWCLDDLEAAGLQASDGVAGGEGSVVEVVLRTKECVSG